MYRDRIHDYPEHQKNAGEHTVKVSLEGIAKWLNNHAYSNQFYSFAKFFDQLISSYLISFLFSTEILQNASSSSP